MKKDTNDIFFKYASALHDDLMELCPFSQIFPVCMPAGEVLLPYAFMQRESVEMRMVKNAPEASSMAVSITICTETYDEGVEYAQKVFSYLNGYTFDFAGVPLTYTLINAAEGYDSGAYLQKLTFNIRINV